MGHSVEPGNRIYFIGYDFVFFAKIYRKGVSSMYGKKLLEITKN